MVFVGGSVTGLSASDPAASDVRPTFDVDCVIELSSRMEYLRLEKKLGEKGFTHDTSRNAPICRKVYKGIKVDIMTTDENILGFSNKWYVEGIENKISKVLPDGTEIFIFAPEYYLAAKFDAHKGRGGKDLRQSHDFEDIIYILDNCNDILSNINKAKQSVRTYLKEECQSLLNNDNLIEGIESALPHGSDSERTEIMEDLIRDIAEIE
jgi:hypothetical protein